MPEKLLNQTWTIRTVSPFARPWTTDAATLEQHSTRFLRESFKSLGKVERDGTYVTSDWIKLEDSHHLFLDARIADAPTAQLLLCFANHTPSKQVRSFAFALVHGDRKVYQFMLDWVETQSGCTFPLSSFRPTSNQVTTMLTDTFAALAGSQTQLEVTFATPRSISKLEELQLTVPPNSLQRLMMDVEAQRPEKRQKLENHDDFMLLKALRLYILEAFKIDAQTFNLIRISNAITIFGANGKIRLLSKDHMKGILESIDMFIREQVHQEALTVKKKKAEQEAVAPAAVENDNDKADESATAGVVAMITEMTAGATADSATIDSERNLVAI